MASSALQRPPRPWLLLCCVLVAVLAAYIPVLGGTFIWDDHHLIEESPLVQQVHPLGEYFARGFWQGDEVQQARSYYRPLSILSLALDRQIYGDNSGGFHLTNLVLHLLSTLLLFRLLSAQKIATQWALVGTAFWALYPRLTEAVAWISGRTDVLATFFVLAALLLSRSPSRLARPGTAFLLLLGLLSKEVALAGVAAVLVFELTDRSSLRERIFNTAPMLLALVAYAALRTHALGIANPPSDLSLERRLLAGAASTGHYSLMLLSPWFPDIQIGRLHHPGRGYIALGSVVGVSALLWFGRNVKRMSRDTLTALTLTGVALVLVLHIVPFSVKVLAADRFLYLPLVGLTLVLTPTLASNSRPRIALAAMGSLIASFAAITFVRANTWSDEARLWIAAMSETTEDPSLSCIELGRVYSRAGLLTEALVIESRGSSPNFDGYAIAVNNAAALLARAGHYSDAVRLLEPMARKYPTVPLFSLNIALFESYRRHFAAARDRLALAFAVYPDYPQARAFAQALPNLEHARRLLDDMPDDAAPLDRARVQAELGLASEAVDSFARGAKSGTLDNREFAEGTWFILAHGDADTAQAMCLQYRARFEHGRDAHLDVACEVRSDTVKNLRAAWHNLR